MLYTIRDFTFPSSYKLREDCRGDLETVTVAVLELMLLPKTEQFALATSGELMARA